MSDAPAGRRQSQTSNDVLSDHDKQVLDALGSDSESSVDDSEVADLIHGLVDRVGELENQVQAIEDIQNRVENLESQQASNDTVVDDVERLATIEKYSQMGEDERENLLGPSDLRAVAIFENWWDMAHKTPKGYVVSTKRNSTKKNNPSQFKLDIERATGESLEWMQVYRAMEHLAKLAGGQKMADDYDRTHIHGGAFEYHEKVTPDGEQTYKMLHLRNEDALTLL